MVQLLNTKPDGKSSVGIRNYFFAGGVYEQHDYNGSEVKTRNVKEGTVLSRVRGSVTIITGSE
jgi:hypothetical protein